jgi:hypothetical protein
MRFVRFVRSVLILLRVRRLLRFAERTQERLARRDAAGLLKVFDLQMVVWRLRRDLRWVRGLPAGLMAEIDEVKRYLVPALEESVARIVGILTEHEQIKRSRRGPV